MGSSRKIPKQETYSIAAYYQMETMTLTIQSANKLRITQRAIGRAMLGIILRDCIKNEEIIRRTRVDDIIGRIECLKWSWVGHVARQDNDRWTKRVVQMRPRSHKRNKGRPQKCWLDDIKQHIRRNWHQELQNRKVCKTQDYLCLARLVVSYEGSHSHFTPLPSYTVTCYPLSFVPIHMLCKC